MCGVKLQKLLLVFGLLFFSEGKLCPEKSRPHKTRCEYYYKCIELPAQKKHVWLPEKCEKGLVYVHNLKVCALPEDDWDCDLEDLQVQSLSSNKVNNDNNENFKLPLKKSSNRDSDIYIVSNRVNEPNFIEHSEDEKVEIILNSAIGREEENDIDVSPYESSGDGIDVTDELLPASPKEATDTKEGTNEIKLPTREESSTTTVDPSLTAHLQRLSQLIDGLKKTYQNRDREQEDLTPDQLNAFLAHFNIKNKFNSLELTPTHDNDKENSVFSPTTPMSSLILNDSHDRDSTTMKINRTTLSQNVSHKLMPETKVVLTSSLPKRFGSTGYSNSQIVVNRPEGSVLFSLPSYSNGGHFPEHEMQYSQNSPKISEETLRTVLELSKQMIATQNVPKVIPNPAYYTQPIIQPLFLQPSPYAPSGSSSINSPFSTYFNHPSGNKYEEHSFGNSRPPNRPQIDYDGKPGTTVIHNNVIPVHVTSTSSGEKEIIDSYGHSLGLYPPLSSSNKGNNNNNDYSFQVTHRYENNKFVTTVRPYVSSTSANQYVSEQFAPPYGSAVTTVRPPLEYPPSQSTISQYYTPSPHLDENNINSIFKPPNQYPTIQYETAQRPLDVNRPDSTQSTFQQLERPSSYQGLHKHSPFPAQIDPDKVSIYPNSEKTESMEAEEQPISFNNFGNNKPQTNTIQYNGDQVNSPSLLSAYTSNFNKNPYLPRPHESNYGNSLLHNLNKPKFSKYGDSSQLVNIGGNFISYDVFQNTILPLIGQSAGNSNTALTNIEVISCQAGIRQANLTDCTRYYVCSKKDGKVLSYSCPPYTAFNTQTRICDAQTYATCYPDAILSSYTVNENKRIQIQAIQALNEAKKRHEDAIKAQKLTNLLQSYNAQLNAQPAYTTESSFQPGNNELNTYVQQAAALAASASVTTTSKPPKKFKYYCKEGDKVPDQNSIYNYFVCYKNAQGMMKGHKMTCSKGLLFCSKTRMCTLPSKCA